jgi:hypothetical protein
MSRNRERHFRPCVVLDPAHACKFLAREPGYPVIGHYGWRSGPCREFYEARRQCTVQEVGQLHTTEEALEQRTWCATASGGGGGKGAGRRECGLAKQVLNTASEKETVWLTLNGHKLGNHRYSQGKTPVAASPTCKARKNAYGR